MSNFKDILSQAREMTDKQLAAEINKKTKLLESEIDEIAPSLEDKENLNALVEILKDKNATLEKKTEAVKNIIGKSSVIVNALKKLIL